MVRPTGIATQGGVNTRQILTTGERTRHWKHCVEKHGGVKQRFGMVQVDRARNDATKRQILEAVRIQRESPDQILNGRGEWNSNRVPRVNAGQI